MEISKEVDLYNYSTMRTHSVGSIMYTPCSLAELKEAIHCCNGKFHIIGGGSNVVFADRVETPIINLMRLNDFLTLNDDCTVTAGCSVRIQKLINFGKDNAIGGFEYLFSLPASVGGIVYMNAGRAKIHHQQISDWLQSVEYLDLNDMKVKSMKVEKSEWTYRCSPFQKMNVVILSATFIMQKSSVEEITARIQERKNFVSANQEGNKPSCGSVFDEKNKFIIRLVKGKRIGGACFSNKTSNWISNDRNGSGNDVIALINHVIKWHKLLGLKCVPEIRVFN